MQKLLLAAAAAAALVVVLVVVAYSSIGGSTVGQANPGAQAGGCEAGINPASVVRPAKGAPGGLDAKQLTNAAVIAAVGRKRSIPARGWLVALATASQESHLRNLANTNVAESMALPHDGVGGDHDSVGIMQQRPSQGWGTPKQLLDPAYAAGKFYDHLLAVPGWQSLPVTVAAQTVQRSAFPDAYADDAALAAQLVVKVGDAASSDLSGCASTSQLPADSKGAAIIAAARRYSGLPYVFDAGDPHGPTKALAGCDAAAIGGCAAVGFDCSGLTLYAWAQVGISLDHYAATQYRQGKQVPAAQARPGDLLFWATNTADEASIHHVSIYLGGDRMIEAPQSGETVHESPVRHDNEMMPMAVEPTMPR